jgi:hypothetical protein
MGLQTRRRKLLPLVLPQVLLVLKVVPLMVEEGSMGMCLASPKWVHGRKQQH